MKIKFDRVVEIRDPQNPNVLVRRFDKDEVVETAAEVAKLHIDSGAAKEVDKDTPVGKALKKDEPAPAPAGEFDTAAPSSKKKGGSFN